MFKDLPEGQTHFQNDGCGEPAHNDPSKLIEPTPPSMEWEERFREQFHYPARGGDYWGERIIEFFRAEIKKQKEFALQEKDAEIAKRKLLPYPRLKGNKKVDKKVSVA